MTESRKKHLIDETRQIGRSALAALHRASAAASELFTNGADAEIRKTVVSVLRTLLPEVSKPSAADRERLRAIFSASRTPSQVDELLEEFDDAGQIAPEEAGQRIAALEVREREALARLFFDFAEESGVIVSQKPYLTTLYRAAGISPVLSGEWFAEAERDNRKKKILSSGAGVAAALLVIAVFILTATLLKSVIFGLIAAYIMLPVQQFFERRLRSRKGVLYCFLHVFEIPFLPLHKLAAHIRSRRGTAKPLGGGEQRHLENRIMRQSVVLTVLLLLFLVTAAVVQLTRVTGSYVTEIRSRITTTAVSSAAKTSPAADPQRQSTAVAPGSSGSEEQFRQEMQQLMEQVRIQLERLRRRVENMPLVRLLVDRAVVLLQNEETQQECISWLLQRAGGFFNFTASLLGTFLSILADLLLTVFFFLLFLFKLAEYSRNDRSARRQSSFLVNTIFSGAWLPGTSEETMEEANAIIGAIIARLRVWVKGYLTLVLIDSTVYMTVFYFLKVPYFPILAILAGCGILLPYIGPFISASVTLIVTLAVGGSSVTTGQFFGIIVAYFIYNGIVEQFILYPAVIGDSLGLTTLETIIVVLLGAIFAGIPGMIFAMPAASVIKYLAPKIYSVLGNIRKPGARALPVTPNSEK